LGAPNKRSRKNKDRIQKAEVGSRRSLGKESRIRIRGILSSSWKRDSLQ